jgi:hypothetical protein
VQPKNSDLIGYKDNRRSETGMNVAICGAVYVAAGDKFVAEAGASLASLRQSNPGLAVALLTDTTPSRAYSWDEVIVASELKGQGARAKLHMDRAPWERCVFLDTDTMVCGDLSPGFALLDRFDFAGEHSHSGHHYEVPGLPTSFPEINSGVLFWRKNAATQALFERWRELYDADSKKHAGRKWDQKSLRQAVYESDVRFTNLPMSYNLMPYFPAALEGRVVVAHGRSMKNLERMNSRLSECDQLRAYVPGIGAMRHPNDMSWSQIAWTIWRLVAVKARGMIMKR